MDDKKQLIKELKAILRKGKYTVYTKVNHVSRSGMMRAISCYTIANNQVRNIDYYVEHIAEYTRNKKHDGVTVTGCGMDMGFAVVYDLSRRLYPKGFKSSRRNAFNGMQPTDPGFDWDNDGGYRLTQKWL